MKNPEFAAKVVMIAALLLMVTIPIIVFILEMVY
jgi:hypothetical protein